MDLVICDSGFWGGVLASSLQIQMNLIPDLTLDQILILGAKLGKICFLKTRSGR